MPIAFSNAPFVLLCCQGRSGSTLLLRLLNTARGYHLMGENKMAIQNLLHYYMSLKHMDEVKNTVDEEHYKLAWQNTFDFAEIKNNIYRIFWDMFWHPQKRVFGFKEIRFGLEDFGNFEDELNAFKELFPNLKIVFLTRDVKELLKSSCWADNPKDSKEYLQRQQKNFTDYIKKIESGATENSDPFVFPITYKDIVKKNENLYKLFDFLGEPFSEEHYLEVMEKITR